MNNTRQPQPWVPYLGFLVAVAGIVYQSGQLTGDVRSNTERIARLEAAMQSYAVNAGNSNERTARIEAKLDVILSDRERGIK